MPSLTETPAKENSKTLKEELPFLRKEDISKLYTQLSAYKNPTISEKNIINFLMNSLLESPQPLEPPKDIFKDHSESRWVEHLAIGFATDRLFPTLSIETLITALVMKYWLYQSNQQLPPWKAPLWLSDPFFQKLLHSLLEYYFQKKRQPTQHQKPWARTCSKIRKLQACEALILKLSEEAADAAPKTDLKVLTFDQIVNKAPVSGGNLGEILKKHFRTCDAAKLLLLQGRLPTKDKSLRETLLDKLITYWFQKETQLKEHQSLLFKKHSKIEKLLVCMAIIDHLAAMENSGFSKFSLDNLPQDLFGAQNTLTQEKALEILRDGRLGAILKPHWAQPKNASSSIGASAENSLV